MKKLSMFLVIMLSLTMIFGLSACNNNENENSPESYPYTVTFNTNGGSTVSSKNMDVILYSPTTIKQDFVFQGWFFDENFTSPVRFPLSVDSNFTVYAKWKETLQSMKKRFADFMKEKDYVIEKELPKDELNFSHSYKIQAIGGSFITYTWERVYISPIDSSYSTKITYNIDFEFGDLTTARGTASYIHNSSTGVCSAGFDFYSMRLEGRTYLFNEIYESFYDSTNMSYTQDDCISDIQKAFLGAINDLNSELVSARVYGYILGYENYN